MLGVCACVVVSPQETTSVQTAVACSSSLSPTLVPSPWQRATYFEEQGIYYSCIHSHQGLARWKWVLLSGVWKIQGECPPSSSLIISNFVPLFMGQRPKQGQSLFHEGKSQQSQVDELEGPCGRLRWPDDSPHLRPSHLSRGQDQYTPYLTSLRLRALWLQTTFLHLPVFASWCFQMMGAVPVPPSSSVSLEHPCLC